MFGIKKTSQIKGHSDLSFLKFDIHSHLIPEMDDGSKSLEESLLLISELQKLKIEKIITTPHVSKDFYPNSSRSILERVEILKKKLKEVGIEVEVRGAAEYFLDGHFEFLLLAGDLLTLNGKDLLIEFSFLGPPINFSHTIFEMQTRGYQPVLAHPERYLYFQNYPAEFSRLKESGLKFQINLNSLSGYYGKAAKGAAEMLLREGMVNYAGTDLHHMKHLDGLKKLLGMNEEMNLLLHYKKWDNWDI